MMKRSIKILSVLILLNTNLTWATPGEPMHLQNKHESVTDGIRISETDGDKITTIEPYDMAVYDQQIIQFYQSQSLQGEALLVAAASLFMEQPYFLEPIGEGKDAKYSQEPLYRTDKFDCVSYVDTVLALIHSKNLNEFRKNLLAIRYHAGQMDYVNRTDWFTDLEWLPNARSLGWLKDVTMQVVDQHKQPVALIAQTMIDKPNWYKVKPLKVMHLLASLPSEQANSLLTELRSNSDRFEAKTSQLSYLPLSKLFNADGSADSFYFDQIPSGSVIAVVRPDWKIRDNFPGFPNGYGTNLNVSHLGLAIRTEQGLMFYHASTINRKVKAEPLTQYLQNHINSPTIKGIHVEKILQDDRCSIPSHQHFS